MASKRFPDSDLQAYLDEALPAAEMAEIEAALRKERELADQLSAINARRDSGVHSLGEIWRRHRVSCPSRQQLGNYLLGVLADDEAAYLKFHLEEVGCRRCEANATDLRNQQRESAGHAASRRRKYFQSSAGYLRSGIGD
jgi:anti-sigma factor RsiW